MRSCWRLLLRAYCNRMVRMCPRTPHFLTTDAALASTPYNREVSWNSTSYIYRGFSSESVEENNNVAAICEMFEKDIDVVDFEKRLEQKCVMMNREMVVHVLKELSLKPDVANKFFRWIMEKDSRNMSEAGYNLMLEIFCSSRSIDEFWDAIAVMNENNYRIFSATRAKAMELFGKDGRDNDLKRLNRMFSTNAHDKEIGLKVSRIVRNRVWCSAIQEEIKNLDVEFSGDLLRVILDNLVIEPGKALVFFRWVEKIVKPDGKSYNAMARVLGREDCIENLWKLIEEMKMKGVELEPKTYSKLLELFAKRKMMTDAVKLTEFAMTCRNKPSIHCCNFLLKRIATGKDFDIELFLQLVKIVSQGGNALTKWVLNSALKYLIRYGKLEECTRVVEELINSGFIPSGGSQSEIALALSSRGMEDKVTEFVRCIQSSGTNLDETAVVSLIEGYCKSGNLDKALHCFQDNYMKLKSSNSSSGLDILVHTYCHKNKALEVVKIMRNFTEEHHLKPMHKTYKTLIKHLLTQGGFDESLQCLDGMRKNGYTLFVRPYMDYLLKRGTEEEAVAFIETTASKQIPSTSIPRQTFQSFVRGGKSNEAHKILSKCDVSIRNHPDILSVFASIQQQRDTASVAA